MAEPVMSGSGQSEKAVNIGSNVTIPEINRKHRVTVKRKLYVPAGLFFPSLLFFHPTPSS